MASGTPSTLRIPMILLAALSLTLLATHLWPWEEVMNLPGNGTVAIDPVISLVAYMGLILWISSGIQESTQRALSAGAMVGIVAGVVLVAYVVLGMRGGVRFGYLQLGLLGVAVILWGVAGLRGSRVAGSAGMGALSGLWGAMMSSLMACAAVLSEFYLAGPAQPSSDPWKQYQGLAIGNTATQGLVHTLNSATGFLLIGPLAGTAVGVIFAFFGQSQKS
jgi:hypothetical protein